MYKLTERETTQRLFGEMYIDEEKYKEWLIFNMRNFLLTEMHLAPQEYDKYKEEIAQFCKDVFSEIYNSGYSKAADELMFV